VSSLPCESDWCDETATHYHDKSGDPFCRRHAMEALWYDDQDSGDPQWHEIKEE